MFLSMFADLSTELQAVLRMMLAPEPSQRPSVSELLALPYVWKHRWKRRIYLMVTEAALTLASVCQVMCLINPLTAAAFTKSASQQKFKIQCKPESK